MKKITSLAAVLLLAASFAVRAEQPAAAAGDKPQSLDDKASYIIGFNLGSNLKQQDVPVNVELIVKGLREGLAGGESLLNQEEVQATMTEFQKQMQAKQEARMAALSEKNKKEAEEFLAANKTKPGVITTASGLQYQILQEGTGAMPTPTDQVTVHYKGTLIDGKVFDSSLERNEPAVFTVGQVIPGWVEALQLLKTGAKAKLFIPPALAYGEGGAGQDIGPNALLIFEVELLKVEPAAAEPEAPAEPAAEPAAPPAE